MKHYTFKEIMEAGAKDFYAVEFLNDNNGNIWQEDGYPVYVTDKEEAQRIYDSIVFIESPDGVKSEKELISVSVSDLTDDEIEEIDFDDEYVGYHELPVRCYKTMAYEREA